MNKNLHILVTGGCGYKGSILVPKLLARGYRVTVVDIQWFGNYLLEHHNLKVVQEDIRNIDNVYLDDVDIIIHLSSVANDPCGDLDPKLTWEISALATMQLADKAVRSGVREFIYASSGSVYGIKSEDQVTEDLQLTPISEYNKTKMVAERALLSYSGQMLVKIVRPATVCGYSPRMRLDVSVNLLTMQALTRKKITVFGGSQVRPNIHLDDITDVYLHMIDGGERVSGIYNSGFENLSILEIAEKVVKYAPAEIIVTESNDPRSYRINSDKLLASGFKPRRNVQYAIKEICEKYEEGLLIDEDRFYNLKWMQTKILNR
jgi:nucleoside-diphosphate-sugar epimerase